MNHGQILVEFHWLLAMRFCLQVSKLEVHTQTGPFTNESINIVGSSSVEDFLILCNALSFNLAVFCIIYVYDHQISMFD